MAEKELIQCICCWKCSSEYGLENQCRNACSRTLADMGDESNCSFCGKPNGGSSINVFRIARCNDNMRDVLREVLLFGMNLRDYAASDILSLVNEGVFVDNGTWLFWVPRVTDYRQ